MSDCIKIISPSNSSRFNYINNQEVVEVTGFLYKNPEFLVYAGEIIHDCTDIEKFINYLPVKFYAENISNNSFEKEKNTKFINLFHSLYSKYTDNDDFAHYRGAILERLTLLLISERYIYAEDIYLPIDKDCLLDNCEIGVDCKVRVIQDNWETSDPIDIAGWNQLNYMGEGYECKVKIDSLDHSDKVILNDLLFKCTNNPYVKKFNVGLVTLSSLEGEEYLNYNYDFNLYGRNNISQLRDDNIFS